MTRRLALVALWVVATVAAVALATFAVRLAGDSVVTDRTAAVARTGDDDPVAAPPGSQPADDAPGGTDPAPADGTPGEVAPPTTSTTGAAGAPGPSTTTPPAGAAPPSTTAAVVAGAPPAGATPTTAAASPTTAPPPTVPPTSSPPPTAATVERSFALVGGGVRVRCTGASASLVTSSPNPGFAMEVRKTGPDEVEVRFTSEVHTSEIKSWCSAGQVAGEPKEQDQGRS